MENENVLAHGAERNQKIRVNNGKSEYTKREKFCINHDWVDVLAIGGDLAWQKSHGNCNNVQHGSFVVPETFKVKKMAA